MSSPNPGETRVSDEAVIRAALPYHGPKRLARLMAVPVETARHWYYRHLSAARRRELALALLAELDAQDRQRAAVRMQLQAMVSADAEMDRVLDRESNAPDRGSPPGAPAGGVGGAMRR